ncbi:MAG: RND transporter [Lentisphaerae bacterium GWF2_45_14]|nr:MAG: RND transporter [Lentisphaerae bacterium GWF2_45_14]
MFSKFFIDRPRFALVISIVITIAGTISIYNLPVAQYPDITPPQVSITTSYPGASADIVQKTVVEPIESQVNGVENMIYMQSTTANDGSATITVTFEIGTDGDMNTVNVQNRVAIANPQLPEEVKRQGVTVKQKSSNMLLVINLFSPKGTYDGIYLSNYMTLNIRDAVMRISGVGDSSMLGGLDYSMRIWIDPDKLTSLNMSVTEVTNAITEQNVQVAAGQIGAPPCPADQQFEFTVQTKGRLSSVEEFENIIVRASSDGSMVKIKDVAKVQLGSQDYSSFSQLNGAPGSLLAVYQLPDANGLQIGDAIKAQLEKMSKSFPEDLKCSILYDTTKFVNSSVEEVEKTLYEAIFLVILIVFVFLQDWRSTIIPSVAIPVSLVGTFAVLYLLGYSINTITLFGLILAIGVVVDDAILVIENVNRLMEEEKLSPRDAAYKTMEQVTGPVIATTLVLLAMFIPVTFLPGITGVLYRQFAVTISVAVTISSINALTLSPALCAAILRPEKPKPFFLFRLYNKGFNGVSSGYAWIVTHVVRKSVLILVLYAVLMLITWKFYTIIPTGFIPNEDRGNFMVDVQLPDGASIKRTSAVVTKIYDILKKMDGVIDVMTVTGYSMLSGTSSSNCALVIVILEDWKKRKTAALSQDSLIRKAAAMFNTIPEAKIFPFGMPAIPGVGTTGGLEFMLQDTLSRSPQDLAAVMGGIVYNANQQPPIEFAYSTYRANVPQIYLDIDREKAKKLGLSLTDVFSTLQTQLGSIYINDFNKFGKVYQVIAQAGEKFRNKIDDISALYVKNNQGDMVPLGTLLEVKTSLMPQVMYRYNLYSSLTINGDIAPGFSSGQAMAALQKSADDTMPPGYKYEWTGMSYQEILAGNKVIMIFGLALTFIYLFLVAQYESWMIPFAVILSVPIAFFGALGALWITGIDNNIYTQVGFVLLFGLACKTAILIVEFAKEQHERQGKDIFESAIFAARLRFRAVLMTSVTFVLGVLPLVIAMGAGAASRRSLGTVIFGGMLVSCIFGTILIPSFFVIIQYLINKMGKPTIPQK